MAQDGPQRDPKGLQEGFKRAPRGAHRLLQSRARTQLASETPPGHYRDPPGPLPDPSGERF